METPGAYYKNQNEKYRHPEEVRDKWIRILRNINPYSEPTVMMKSVKEAFVLVECVMKNILFDYRRKYASMGILVPDTKATYRFRYDTGDVIIDFTDYTVFGMTKYLRALGYQLPDDIDETRKLRNFFTHNLETTTVDYFRDNMSYELVIQALYNLGYSLVAMGMLSQEDVQPSFDALRVKEGDVVGMSGEFTVDRFIAKTGTSRLYQGTHTRLKRKVAIKELIPKTFSEQLLNNERDLLVSLRHSRIPNIYDVFNQNGTFYIVMDYIEGTGLDAYIKNNRCTMQEKLRIIYDICDVVNYLHATMGMVHADLKPQNVMIGENDTVYIIDFGTAYNKRTGNNLRGVSAGYTAPEVTAGKPIDYRIDIYSIGAIMKFVFAEELADAESNYSQNTEAINNIIIRCMQYDPYARYNNVVEIQYELKSILDYGTASLSNATKPKKHIDIPRLILYIVCIVVIVISTGIKLKQYIDAHRKNETGMETEASVEGMDNSQAADDKPQSTSGETVTDEEALVAFKELENRAWQCLVTGDEDGYIDLFRYEPMGETKLRENFKTYSNNLQDIYNDCDYILLCNENGICYGCATRTLVSGEGVQVNYVRREFTYPFSYKDGEWKFDVTSETSVITDNKVQENVQGALPSNYSDAKKSGRNYKLFNLNNYLWLDSSLVYEGMVDASVVAASQFMDGSVEFTVSIKNGTNREQTVGMCTVSMTMSDGNKIVTGYTADINATIKSDTSMLVSFIVPKESVENISAVWDEMSVEISVE